MLSLFCAGEKIGKKEKNVQTIKFISLAIYDFVE